jgi:AraC-like DNA-binding protein
MSLSIVHFMDPFLDLIRLLRPQATLWGGIDGAGRWGVSFRKRDDLLFCWLERGECLLTRPNPVPPIRLRTDDSVLIRTTAPFALTTDLAIEPDDSEAAVAAARNTRLRVGQGEGAPVTLHGGRFVFDTANEDLLTNLLPPLVHIPAEETSSSRVRALLSMNKAESRRPGPGGEFIVGRLMELILVEILRSGAAYGVDQQGKGLIAGLSDPVTAPALSAMHGDIARDWTVSSLARLCGVSRSKFATRFRDIVGMAPIPYLQHWRMAHAKDELRLGTKSIGTIALAMGFQSLSAFSTAFTRVVGCSPRRFADP